MQVDTVFCGEKSHTHSEVTPWHERRSTKEKAAIHNHENGTSQKMAYTLLLLLLRKILFLEYSTVKYAIQKKFY
jgi:hypothetical protein